MGKKKSKKSRVKIQLRIDPKIHLLILGILSGITIAVVTFSRHPVHSSLPCANTISCLGSLSGKIDDNSVGTFMGKKVVAPLLSNVSVSSKEVLGSSTGVDKHIYIDLTSQRLYAFEGNKLVFTFLVSSGKWNPTPKGDFVLWAKVSATRMIGGNSDLGTYYDLPDVPYVMYFYNEHYAKSLGYGLNGTYWQDTFGHPASYGDINLPVEDAHHLYDWVTPSSSERVTYTSKTNPGTPVTIYGDAPGA